MHLHYHHPHKCSLHSRSPTFNHVHSPSYSFIYPQSCSFSIIYLHSRSLTRNFYSLPFVNIPFTLIYLHLLSFMFIYLHFHSFAFVYDSPSKMVTVYGAGIMEDYLLLIFNTHISFQSCNRRFDNWHSSFSPTTFFDIAVNTRYLPKGGWKKRGARTGPYSPAMHCARKRQNRPLFMPPRSAWLPPFHFKAVLHLSNPKNH